MTTETSNLKMQRDIKLLEARQNSFFSRIQRIYDSVKTLKGTTSKNTFCANATLLIDIRSEFKEIVNKINEINLTINPEFTPNFQMEQSFDELYAIIQLTARQIDSENTNQSSSCIITEQKRNNIKLPKLTLPSFNGNLMNWKIYYETFRKIIHENTELSNAEKIQYLVGSLTDKALNVCAGISTTADNYEIIWNALIDKYEDSRAQATYYFDQILNIKQIAIPTASTLEAFIDQFHSSISALQQLKIPNLLQCFFLYIGTQKLDKQTAIAFESSVRKSETPSYDDFVIFLREQVKILQRTSTLPEYKSQQRMEKNSPKKQYSQAFVSLTNSKIKQYDCAVCNLSDHTLIYKCPTFLKASPKNRFEIVQKQNLCRNCLSKMHFANKCKSENRCKYCSQNHHSLLHFNTTASDFSHDNEQDLTENSERESEHQSDNVTLCTLNNGDANVFCPNQTVLLGTASINVLDSRNNYQKIRVLIDSASQNDFITTECCQRLGLHLFPNRNHATIRGIGDIAQRIKGITNLKFESRYNNKISFSIRPLVVDRITTQLPASSLNLNSLSYLNELPLADDGFHTPGVIDAIIGANLFGQIILPGKVKGTRSLPSAIETSLGYIIIGNAPTLESSYSLGNAFCTTTEPSVEELIAKFWQLEEVTECEQLSPEEKECDAIYDQSTIRDTSGRYIVNLPFKDPPEILGDSYHVASRRFLILEKRLNASLFLRQNYNNVIMDYLEKDYLSPVNPDRLLESSYYIPHHSVLRDDKTTTKLRIVLDASCKTSTSYSLNDILHSGKNLQADLFKVLMNVRLFPIVISADIRQMYLQILVKEDHRRFQRIVFRFRDDDPLQVYEFSRVCFGMRCSPYLALRTIRQLAKDEQKKYPLAAETITRDIYMDDIATSVMSEKLAIEHSQQLINLFKSGGFDLVKFSSNSSKVLLNVPEFNRLSSVVEFNDDNFQKILGLQWLPSQDIFTISVNSEYRECTKRNILSTIARLWDVMGFVAPVILYAKLLIKSLWLLKIDWDADPPPNIRIAWEQFYTELPSLQNIRIPRHIGIDSDDSVITILGFADASEKAYGGVVYVHVSNNSENKKNLVHLLCAKSKVAPVKTVSLARLELCAALLLSKLCRVAYNTLSSRHRVKSIFAFSDSTVALSWIHSSPHQWQTFVGNRVSKIQDNLESHNFYHIAGQENPSDCLSRGLTPAQLINHPLWYKGPPWTHLNVEDWPIEPFSNRDLSNIPEPKVVAFPITTSEYSPLYILANRISSWPKLLRITVYVLRFVRKISRSAHITSIHLEIAERAILCAVQVVHFENDIKHLQKKRNLAPALRKLRPFLDNNLIRVGGRLKNSDLSYNSQHPILLPSKEHVTTILIDYHHKKYLHAGPQLLMSLLRQKYWILSARNLIRKRVHLCNTCFKTNPKSNFPIMGDLPECRVKQSKPFLHTGVDHAGPIAITMNRQRGTRRLKAYICLFICLVTRAVHIELVSDLSTDCFLNAFKRFIARRGPCGTLYSDNGTAFIGAKSYLDDLYHFLGSEQFKDAFSHTLSEYRVNWKFNPPSAPHFGGIWEANVRSVKTHLYRVIGEQLLTYEELSTILAQIEALLNSRPLAQLSSDPLEPLALTPAHFLTLTPLTTLPSADVSQEPVGLLKRKSMLDHMVQNYWRRWKIEYLNSLQTRLKWNTPVNPVQKGTIVILKADNAPPLHWPLGIIDEVYPGKDGIVRVVLVRTKTGSYKRPVVKVCPLPNQ